MSSKKYQDHLESDYWKAVSKAVKARAKYRCQLCNSQHDLHAHHRTYDNRGKELDHLDDLTCLCRRCHEIFHGHIKPESPKPKEIRKRIIQVTAPNTEVDVSREMPPGDGNIILTNELINRTRTNGSFTTTTLRALGVASTHMKSGWVSKLIGASLPRERYRAALQGRFCYARKTLNRMAKKIAQQQQLIQRFANQLGRDNRKES